jgi:hypothetical protein
MLHPLNEVSKEEGKMKRIPMVSIVLCILLSVLMPLGCSPSNTEITENEVIVAAGQLDVRFSRVRSFAGTYMLFGGAENNHGNAFTKITLFGLEQSKAKYIHARFPDFHKCKSPGAPLAQKETRDLDIVPADSKVLKNLKKSLAAFNKSITDDGERVCVRLKGEVLKLTSVVVREMNQDITAELPPAVHKEYFFVESAEVIGFQQAIMGP